MVKLVKTGLIVLGVSMLLSACGEDKTINLPMMSDKDIQYYQKISAFKNTDRESIEEYIQIYVKYRGFDIPEPELNKIKSLTEEELYKLVVANQFQNTRTEQTMTGSDGNTYQGEAAIFNVENQNEETEYKDEEVNYNEDTIVNVVYNFMNNAYVAKINSAIGYYYYNIIFKVDNGKVVDIIE